MQWASTYFRSGGKAKKLTVLRLAIAPKASPKAKMSKNKAAPNMRGDNFSMALAIRRTLLLRRPHKPEHTCSKTSASSLNTEQMYTRPATDSFPRQTKLD